MAGFTVDYEYRNPKAHDNTGVKEWLKSKEPAVLKKGKQPVEFEDVSVPVVVGPESITVFVREIAEAYKDCVVLPLLPGFSDTDEPTLDLADPSFGESVFDYEALTDGDVVVYIYSTNGDSRASLVFVD